MRRWAILVVILLIAQPVAAQGDCGHGLPCGPIPWPLPQLPVLESPTPFETAVFEATNTPEGPTPTPSVTPTPSNTPEPTPAVDTDPIQDSIATLQAMLDTELPEVDADLDDTEELTTSAGTFFAYIKAVLGLHLGPLNPLMAFLLFLISWFLGVKIVLFILPFAGLVWGFVRKLIQLILEFIPG